MGNITQTDFGFTGQRNISSLGLYDYHARMYDPTIGRFIQADSIIPGAGPQALNRYSYVLNDPIGLIDPSGQKPCWATKHYTCNNLTKKLAEEQYSLYKPKDQPAVAAFFATYGFNVSNNGGSGGNESAQRSNFCVRNPVACGSSINDGGKVLSLILPKDPTQNSTQSESVSRNCDNGWVSALTTPDGSCGHITINGNEIFDPLAMEHIGGAAVGGVVLIGMGVVMIGMGAELCTSVVGCVAGAMLIFPGVIAIPEGGVLIYSSFKFTQKYLDELLIVKP